MSGLSFQWSRSRTLIAGAALIVVANAVALLGVAYNRSGEPESVLTLSQRELVPHYNWRLEGESEGLTLQLRWRVWESAREGALRAARPHHSVGGGAPEWFGREKLQALGFDLSLPLTTEAGRRFYRKQQTREALLVLELNGPAYRRSLEATRQWVAEERALASRNDNGAFAKRLERAEQALEDEERENSRLFVVDAGLERKALRSRYSDRNRYAIVHGRVRLWLEGGRGNERVEGRVVALEINEINVPHALQSLFDPLRKAGRWPRLKSGARFEATVAFGQRLEPWLTGAAVR